MDKTDTSPRNITTDHETIREWVEARGGQPAHVTGQDDDDASSLYIVQEDEAMEGLDPFSWDEFFETFEAEGLAFVYQDREVGETDEWLYDLVDRQEVAERATHDSTEIEAALLEGEVVESEITETTVIEKTVVETDRIESKIVDSEIIETTEVDREPIAREVVGVAFSDGPEGLSVTVGSSRGEPIDEKPVADRMESTERTDQAVETETGAGRDIDTDVSGETEESADDPSTEPVGGPSDGPAAEPTAEPAGEPSTDMGDESVAEATVEPTEGLNIDDEVVLEVRDTVMTTTEVFDRKTVESRVVEREIAEEDTVETDAVDLESVEETILESDIVAGELVGRAADSAEEPLPSGAITSERGDDAIRSQFVERRVVETESTEHYELPCEISEHRLVDAVDRRTSVVERAIVDREAGEEAMLREPEAGIRTTDEQLSAAEKGATASAEATPEVGGEAGAEPLAESDDSDSELESETASEAMEVGTASESPETGAETETETGTETGTETESAEMGTEPAGVDEGPTVTDDDLGKRVVAGDEEIGMVTDVDDGTLYVDPEPSLADRIKTALDWGDTDDDAYPVEADQIESITDEEVRIRDM